MTCNLAINIFIYFILFRFGGFAWKIRPTQVLFSELARICEFVNFKVNIIQTLSVNEQTNFVG